MIDQTALAQLNAHHITGLALLANPRLRLQRVNLAGCHRVPEEDARVRLRHHRRHTRGAESHRGVLTRGAAPEVRAADDDGVLGLGLVGVDEAGGVGGREAAERVGAELLVLGGVGGD